MILISIYYVKKKTAYEISACLVGSGMWIRDRFWAAVRRTLGEGFWELPQNSPCRNFPCGSLAGGLPQRAPMVDSLRHRVHLPGQWIPWGLPEGVSTSVLACRNFAHGVAFGSS